jgi:AcrR family transcriptional regulator
MNPATTTRRSAAERRQEILDAAADEIAVSGFAGATTAAIARRAGISQPYVFRFFPTKKELALAVLERCLNRVLADWEAAVPEPGETRLQTLGRTYVQSLPSRRRELLVTLQAYAAAEDPDVAEIMRHNLSRLYRYIIHQARRDGHEDPSTAAAEFLSRGFLINAAMAIGLESALTAEEWSGICPMSEIARLGDRLEHESSS